MSINYRGCIGSVDGFFLEIQEFTGKENRSFYKVRIGNPDNYSNITLFVDPKIIPELRGLKVQDYVVLNVDFQLRGYNVNPIVVGVVKKP